MPVCLGLNADRAWEYPAVTSGMQKEKIKIQKSIVVTENLVSGILTKLRKKAHIVFEKHPQVWNSEFKHGNTFQTQTKGKTAKARLISDRRVNSWIDHSATQYLNPACRLAYSTWLTMYFASSATYAARYVHLS